MRDVIFNIFPNENYIDLGLYQCGREQCAPAHIFGPAARNHYLFHYIHRGKGTLIAPDRTGKNQTFHLHAGQGFLIYPGQITTYFADEKDPWEYAWIEFDGLRVQAALDLMNITVDDPVYRAGDVKRKEAMVQEIEYILHHMDDSSFATIGHLYLFFDDFMKSARQPVEHPTNSLADFYVREAVSFIENNYAKDITIEQISKALGINRSYFGKLFKRVTGKAPMQFLLQYRMTKAAGLLQVTDLKIAEISAQVSYENQLHFSRAFKSLYNKSPKQYRQETRRKKPVELEPVGKKQEKF